VRKEKVNLTIDVEVVKQAKEQRINMSKFTEKMLRGYTAAKKPEGDVHEAYSQLFESIVPLLKEFDCRVQVAETRYPALIGDGRGNDIEIERPISIYIMADGSLYLDEDDRYFEDIREIHKEHFFEPQKILSNLVNALSKSKEARDDRINEILMAKNIIEAISKRLIKKYSIAE
jgi:hypothetical protein